MIAVSLGDMRPGTFAMNGLGAAFALHAVEVTRDALPARDTDCTGDLDAVSRVPTRVIVVRPGSRAPLLQFLDANLAGEKPEKREANEPKKEEPHLPLIARATRYAIAGAAP
jgi:hypothetical protein